MNEDNLPAVTAEAFKMARAMRTRAGVEALRGERDTDVLGALAATLLGPLLTGKRPRPVKVPTTALDIARLEAAEARRDRRAARNLARR